MTSAPSPSPFVQLWTVQPLWLVKRLLQEGELLAYPQHDENTFVGDPDALVARSAYQWLCTQMEARGMARPSPDAWPFWAWYQWAGTARKKPDLRSAQLRNWAGNERYALLELELPADSVLLSDYDAWHAPLNYWYFGTEAQSEEFERRAKERGLSPYLQKPLPCSELDKELKRSWEQAFNLAQACEVLEVSPDQQVVQATFWVLRLSDVRGATSFGAGAPRERLDLARLAEPSRST